MNKMTPSLFGQMRLGVRFLNCSLVNHITKLWNLCLKISKSVGGPMEEEEPAVSGQIMVGDHSPSGRIDRPHKDFQNHFCLTYYFSN